MTAFKRPRPYRASRRSGRRWGPRAGILLIALLLLLGIGFIKVTYTDNLKPVGNSQTTSYFTVQTGDTVKTIAANLKSSGLIRSSGAFEAYVRREGVFDQLKHGTYSLSPSMSVQTIVKKMVNNDVTKNLLTILPGKRLDQIKQAFSRAGYSDSEIAMAFNPATYAGDPALASLPHGATLEGFLYPDSFQQTSDTSATTIVKESIDEMGRYLTSDLKNSLNSRGYSLYQGIVLASIVYQESDNPVYEPTIAQVFFTRLSQNIALESNVTFDYAADIAGLPRSSSINSPYNTYLAPGLPPGPISNVTKQALNAVAHPSTTNYLYFIADEKTGAVYFSTTRAEHDAQAQQHCPNTCQ